MRKFNIALLGYNAETDNNPDHFSLFTDIDNVLIKRLTTGSQTLDDPVYPENYTSFNYAHNLNYIPFFAGFADNNSDGKWSLINNQYNPFQVPNFIGSSDLNNFNIWNFGGHASQNLPVAYDIFYDDMSNANNVMVDQNLLPQSASNDTSHGSFSWSNPTNAEVEDGNVATCSFGNSAGDSNYLHANNFGFNIPVGATILGVRVARKGSFGGSGVGYSNLRLVVGGVVSGNTYNAGMGGTLNWQYFGGSSDLWGLTLTPAQVNSSDFGVVLWTSLSSATGASANIDAVKIDVFYYTAASPSNVQIAESKPFLKIPRPGKSSESKNPNDYIVHTSLNNFKILKSGVVSGTITSASGKFSFAHGANVNTPYKFFAFVKFPDGKTVLTGGAIQTSYNDAVSWIYSSMDSVNINIYAYYGSDVNVTVSYFIYGTGKDGTATPNGKFMVGETGLNVLAQTNPDNFKFHSSYPTLKYYTSGSYLFQASTTTIITIPHSLGYVPFFVGFVNDIANFMGGTNYCLAPFYRGGSTIAFPNADYGAFVYADATNIYLKAYFQPNAVGTVVNFDFHYKIFKNNLGL